MTEARELRLMIDALVFSKDRAPQLDLLLRSMRRFAPNLYSSVTVLYTGSSREYLHGYARCEAANAGLRFERERDFERQTRRWLADARGLISFLVDDDVFYRPAPDPARDELPIPLSLRGSDYWYPFSVDGNIYDRVHVEELLRGLSFRNPTELESRGHLSRERLPFAEVAAWRPPCLVGVPANRVSASSTESHMGVDTDVLNAAYLAGARLELEAEPTEDLLAHAWLHYRLTGIPAASTVHDTLPA